MEAGGEPFDERRLAGTSHGDIPNTDHGTRERLRLGAEAVLFDTEGPEGFERSKQDGSGTAGDGPVIERDEFLRETAGDAAAGGSEFARAPSGLLTGVGVSEQAVD